MKLLKFPKNLSDKLKLQQTIITINELLLELYEQNIIDLEDSEKYDIIIKLFICKDRKDMN